MTNIEKERKRTRWFQIYGFFVGGIIPLLIVISCQLYCDEIEIIPKGPFIYIICASLLITGLALFATLYNYQENPGLVKRVYTSQAGLCFLVIHFLVLLSGGAKDSIFSFSYLYIPTVVGFTYGKKGRNLTYASLILGASYIANLLFSEWQIKILNIHPKLKSNPELTAYYENWILLAMFVIQLTIIYVFATKHTSVRDSYSSD